MSCSLRNLSDDQVVARFRDLARRDHALEADLLAHLGELDHRRLHAREGYPSLFRYCVDALNFSEAVAYLRIGVARRARCVPELLEAVRRGDLHLSGARLLAPHLTTANAGQLIAAACGKTKAQIEELIAEHFPKLDRDAHVQRLPQAGAMRARARIAAPARPASMEPTVIRHTDPAKPTSVPAPLPPPAPAFSAAPRELRSRSEPLGRERYRISFTLDRAGHEQLQELRGWMRHRIPDGDLGAILAQAVALLHAREHKRRSAQTASPRPSPVSSGSPSRHVPAAIRRAVWKRDGGRCSYQSRDGRRCGSREFLELDHREPWARVRRHSVENLRILCRTHNQLAARMTFGDAHMSQYQRQRTGTGNSFRDESEPTRSEVEA